MAQAVGKKLTGWQKALLWLLAIVILWEIITTDTVGNALLGFFLGGEVPGTNIVLPPDVIMWGTLGVVGLITIVTVIRLWVNHRRVQRWSAMPTNVYDEAERDTPALVGAAVVRAVEIEKPKQKVKTAAKPDKTDKTKSNTKSKSKSKPKKNEVPKAVAKKTPQEAPKQPRQSVWWLHIKRAGRRLDEWLGIWVPRLGHHIKVACQQAATVIKAKYATSKLKTAQATHKTAATVKPKAKQSGDWIVAMARKTAKNAKPFLKSIADRTKRLTKQTAVVLNKIYQKTKQVLYQMALDVKQMVQKATEHKAEPTSTPDKPARAKKADKPTEE